MQIYKAVIESKLLYSLGSLVLTKQEKRRIDGFQNRCLRSILGIHTSYPEHQTLKSCNVVDMFQYPNFLNESRCCSWERFCVTRTTL